MIYNSLGRKTHMDDPDMGQWDYQYDPNGNMTLQTDAKGQRIQFGYDAINRIELKDYLDTAEPSVTYQYDQASVANGIGQLHQQTNTNVTTVYAAYDEMGRPKEMTKNITGTGTRTTLWDYDYSGKVTRLTYPHTAASSVFHVDYDFYPGTSLLRTATGSDATVFAALSDYAPSGKIGFIDFGNGVDTDYTYDGWSERLTGILTTAAAGAVAQDRQYTYSPAGDITEIDDLARVETYYYSYDKMRRLKSETTSTGSLGVIPAIMEMRYDDPDHIHAASSVVHKGVTRDYAYDPNGNMESGPDLTDPMAVVTRSLVFDADNMPVSVVHPSGGSISLTYDGESKRAKKSGLNGDNYYFDKEFEIRNGVETAYVFAGNLRVAKVKLGSMETIYFHKDHLKSSTVMTRADGTVKESAMYMPYGGKRGGAEIAESDYLFTDQEKDKETGLYNYDARLYDPIVGRFISPDSIVPDSYDSQAFDRYAYTLNNPIIYSDPSGHFVVCGSIAIGYAAYQAAVVTITITSAVITGLFIGEQLDNHGVFSNSSATINDSPPTIHSGKQGKHVPGHNNFIPGRSELTHPDPQGLLDGYAGTGAKKGNTEYVDFGQKIGNVVDPETGEKVSATRGKIHYDEEGKAHIVPTSPEAPTDAEEGQPEAEAAEDGDDNSSDE